VCGAAREQARISGIEVHPAAQLVTMVVNHLAHPQQQAPRFTAEARLREAAAYQTLRHAAPGKDSRPGKPRTARGTSHKPRDSQARRCPRSRKAASGPLISARLEGLLGLGQPPLIGLLPSARRFANTVLNPIDRQDVPSRTDRRLRARSSDPASLLRVM
jgi:hypothetical protein